MNFYETLYIVHPALESGRLKDIISSLGESLKKMGGKTLSIDLWGKKRLAYLIDKQKYGTYVQLQFTGEGNCCSSFEMELEHNPNVLSYLTTLIEKADVVEQENDLDIQIAGQSREIQTNVDADVNTVKKNTSESEKLVENEKTSLVDTVVAEGEEQPLEESIDTSGKRTSESVDNDTDPYDKSEVEEVNTEENKSDSVEKNQKNTDKTSVVSEEE